MTYIQAQRPPSAGDSGLLPRAFLSKQQPLPWWPPSSFRITSPFLPPPISSHLRYYTFSNGCATQFHFRFATSPHLWLGPCKFLFYFILCFYLLLDWEYEIIFFCTDMNDNYKLHSENFKHLLIFYMLIIHILTSLVVGWERLMDHKTHG